MASAAFRSKAVVLLFIISLWGLCLLIVLLCITKMRGSRKVRQGVAEALDNVYNVFHRGSYGPPSRSKGPIFTRGVRTRISKEAYSHLWFSMGGGGGPVPALSGYARDLMSFLVLQSP